MYWRNSIDLQIDTSSKNHIDAIVNKGKRRFESWNLLRQLNNRFNLPWGCVRNFNELLKSSEKRGGSNRSQAQMQLFREAVDECGFIDLGFVGSQFTWQKHFTDGHSIWERLDRALVNNEWMLRFVDSRVHHLSVIFSDHSPL